MVFVESENYHFCKCKCPYTLNIFDLIPQMEVSCKSRIMVFVKSENLYFCKCKCPYIPNIFDRIPVDQVYLT